MGGCPPRVGRTTASNSTPRTVIAVPARALGIKPTATEAQSQATRLDARGPGRDHLRPYRHRHRDPAGLPPINGHSASLSVDGESVPFTAVSACNNRLAGTLESRRSSGKVSPCIASISHRSVENPDPFVIAVTMIASVA